uniref:Harmonin-binding protein USHBP1 PDZ-binding domain-containing protein n=1 Tax=Strigamia maritima TaxID=126957 RepID=T1JC16_STRMM
MTSLKYDSWEFDSGARDLSPEPNALCKLIEAAGENIPNSTAHLLEMANKLHLAALNSLKSEIIDLNSRFQRLNHERDILEKQLNKSQLEKLRFARDTDDRLEQQSQQYEERLTELHSVIAELTKKFENQKENVIREEDEMSQRSNDTFSQIISNDNNPNESFTDTEDVIGDLPHRVDNLPLQHHHMSKKMSKNINHALPQSSNDIEDVSVSSSDLPSSHLTKIHILQSENTALQEQLNRREAELNKSRSTLANMRDERDRLRKKIRELQSKLQGVHSQSSQGSQTGSPTHSKTMCINSTTGERTPTSREDAPPITKIAERIKLKKVESGDRHILGADFVTLGMSNTKVVEHLVRPLQDDSSAQEIFQSLYSSGSKATENCLREFEIEMERLNSKIEHLKAQNDLLTFTLEESKTQCNSLSVLIGKYESNCTAYQLAISTSDQMIEAYDVVTNLLETETGLLLANCRAAGLGGFLKTVQQSKTSDADERQEVAALLKKAQEERKNCEIIAKHLVQRFDRNNGSVASYPWDQMSTISCVSNGYETDLNKCDEHRLREHITHLKNSRNRITTTIMELESIHIDPLTKEPPSIIDAQKFDLENAVLMQELMAIKEEKVELKAQVYLLERERASLELQIRSLEAQEQAHISHIDHLKSEMREQELTHEKNNIGNKSFQVNQFENRYSDASIDLVQELEEANQRDKKLKARIQELVSTLEKVTKNSDLRHQQSAEFVNDLKRANSALVIAFEKSKRKYQSKIKN